MVIKIFSAKLGNHLGITFDNQLTFFQNTCGLYKIARNKLHAPIRASSDVNVDSNILLYDLYFSSLFVSGLYKA